MVGVRPRGVVAQLVVLMAGLLLVPTPPAAGEPATDATAADCDGVAVLVDPGALGGSDTTACVTETTASAAFDAAGISLEFLPQQQGFVCRIDGRPADGPCFDGDAYWSLWWSDGSQDWAYATLGVTALEVPNGGAVAFTWHEGAGSAVPPETDVEQLVTTTEGTADATPSVPGDSQESSADDGVPGWGLGVVVVVVLLGALVPLLRRRAARTGRVG